MTKSNREVNGEKVFRYSIRKYHFGAASVAVAALMFFANGAVKADTLPVSPATANTEKVNVGVTELTEGVPPKENPIEKSKEEVEGDKIPVAQKLVDKSPLVQAISDLQAAIAKVDEESLLSLSNQLTQLTDENNRLLNGENISEEAIASQVSRVQFLTEQVRLLKSKTKDKASNKEDGSGSKAQDKKEVEVSENAVTLVNQTEEIKKSVKDVKVEEVFTNKTKLETLLKEIDKLDPEKYTEDSVKGLKEKVAKAKEVLTIAKNQEEVNSVYKELVNYKNSSLRRVRMTHKPLEENTPKLDTTNGKETVGKKAENTDPSDRNIAGHNHILNGITLPEGSGLRAAPNNANFRYETDGADLSSLVAGEELGYGKKVIIKVRYDKSVISSRDINITTTPNTGPRIEYTNKYRDGIAPFDGGSNVKLVGQIPNDMIGTYDLHVHILNNKNSNSQITTLKIPITVKPKKPTVSVADLVNAEGKRPVVTATVANTSISKVEFYLNGQKQTEVNATNGQATWTPTNALRENDRITVKNIAKGGIPPRDAYGNTFTTRETASDMSDPVVIPKAPKPAFDLGAEKSNAKAELGRIAQAEITAINGDKSLTTTEKTAKVQEVNTKKTQGEQAIDAASVNDADKVAQAKETAKTAIEGVHTPGNLATVKSNAKAELGRIAQAEITAINGDKSLTTTEKTAKVQEVNTKKTQGEQAIDAASVNDADKVAQAKETAKTAIEGVHTPGNLATVKSNAKAELGRIAQAEITAINGDKSLTTTEKTAKVQEVNTKKTQGEQAIDAASVNDADKVAQAKETAKTAIEGVHTPGNLATVKSNAKAELGRIAQAEITAINGDKSLTTTEKTAKVQEVNTKKTQGEQAIDAASVNDADKVAQAKETAKTAIEGVHTPGNLATVKSNAKAELGRIAQAEITAINGDKSLTTTEKTAKVQEVNTKKTQGEQAIDAASVNDADKVAQAKETAKTAIEGVHTPGNLATVKSNAKAELGRIAQAEITAINGDKSLTTTEKTAKVQEVNTKKTQGEQAIDAASVNDADKVAQAKETAKTAIEGVHTPGNLATVKSNAKAALEEAAKAEKSEIASDNSVTSADRVTQTNAVDTKKTEAEGQITSAVDADAVAAAKTAGEAAIRGVHNNGDLESLKTAAKAALEEAAKAEKSEIASDNSVTSADRVTQTNAVDTKKTEAEGQITSAVDADAVAAAKTAGEAAIRGVHNNGDLESLKTAAKAALEEAAKAEKSEIAGDKSLTAAQRAEKEKAVDTTKAAEEAKITAADDADKVEAAKTAGVSAIKAVHTVGSLDDVKAAAKALPNTGTVKSTLAIPVAITSALLSLGLVGGRRRKEDEEV